MPKPKMARMISSGRLTERGQSDAKRVAKWIRQHQPKHLRVIVSPTVRTQQTVADLGLNFETERRIALRPACRI